MTSKVSLNGSIKKYVLYECNYFIMVKTNYVSSMAVLWYTSWWYVLEMEIDLSIKGFFCLLMNHRLGLLRTGILYEVCFFKLRNAHWRVIRFPTDRFLLLYRRQRVFSPLENIRINNTKTLLTRSFIGFNYGTLSPTLYITFLLTLLCYQPPHNVLFKHQDGQIQTSESEKCVCL